MDVDDKLKKLVDWLIAEPTVVKTDTPSRGIGSRVYDDGAWWVKFTLDLAHRDAWTTVQLLGYALNDPRLSERFLTTFKPISPPPYLNGGPEQYLSWVIEGENHDLAHRIAELMQGEFETGVPTRP